MSIQRFGCRLTIMLGGTISMIGLAVSSVAPNLLTLFFTYGVITGKKLKVTHFTYVYSFIINLIVFFKSFWTESQLHLVDCGHIRSVP